MNGHPAWKSTACRTLYIITNNHNEEEEDRKERRREDASIAIIVDRLIA